MKELKYKLATPVYHITDGTMGIVVEAHYCYSNKQIEYTVAWSFGDYTTCREWELSDSKTVF
jgi:hypothetical protein